MSSSKRRSKSKNNLRSGFEGTIEETLKEHNVTYQYEPIKIPYVTEAMYLPDFVVGTVYLEVKGYFDPAARRKMREVKRSNPTLDIRLVFQRDNFTTKAKKQKYSDWAKKHGFQYAIGDVPTEWLKEFKKKCKKERS